MRASDLTVRTGARRRAGGLTGAFGVLWRFARPHTIIGTTTAIAALYVIAAAQLGGHALWDLWWVLVAGWCVNVFIVGINQLEDVEIDRINKPELPIAAGELAPEAARRIVAACAVVPLALGLTQGWIELGAVAVSLAVGVAYSCPPLRLKRFPVLAAASITLVRSAVLNLAVWIQFSQALGGGTSVSAPAWALTAVTLPFAFAIAVLKDLPDVEGDRRFAIATFSVRLGARPVLALGVGALTVAGLGMAVAGATVLDGASVPLLVGAHLAGVALVWTWALRLDTGDRAAVARFYQLVWRLFFCEYLVVAAAYVLG
jgi:homogentisate phytyltransferase / homogentisate geranylgeranyltransferase